MQARSLAQALAARGHDVLVIGMRPARARRGIPEAAIAGRRGRTVSVHDLGVQFAFVPPRGGRVGAAVSGPLPIDLADRSVLVPLLRDREVVHVIAREWPGSYENAARRVGARVVETPLVHPGQPFSGDSRSDLERYRRDDAVIALTEWEAGWYRARGVERVHVTGVGPLIAEVPEADPDPATVLYVGRKERYKGYDALCAAAPIVWRDRPDARFIAIGQRAWRGVSPPRDERWVELGVVDEPTKARAYAHATVLAMPSDHETFGHTYLEAWAASRPVIAGDIPPLREVVRDGVDGIHARNEPGSVAAAILGILADPDGARRMGRAGKDRLAERFTWEEIARRTEAVYQSALG